MSQDLDRRINREVMLRIGTEKLIDAAREFIVKVDRGEARSVKSYAAFKEALAMIDGEGME